MTGTQLAAASYTILSAPPRALLTSTSASLKTAGSSSCGTGLQLDTLLESELVHESVHLVAVALGLLVRQWACDVELRVDTPVDRDPHGANDRVDALRRRVATDHLDA